MTYQPIVLDKDYIVCFGKKNLYAIKYNDQTGELDEELS